MCTILVVTNVHVDFGTTVYVATALRQSLLLVGAHVHQHAPS